MGHVRSVWVYTAHPFYGSRKLTVLLSEHFVPINHKRVQRYMREMGIAPGPNLSKRLTDHRVYPYLFRGSTAQHPNHIWGCDITAIRLRHGWLYLVAIIDWYSRYVISWMLDETLAIGFVLEAIEQARAHGIPQIWNTDQGSHCTSPQVTQPLEALGVQISMMDAGGHSITSFLSASGQSELSAGLPGRLSPSRRCPPRDERRFSVLQHRTARSGPRLPPRHRSVSGVGPGRCQSHFFGAGVKRFSRVTGGTHTENWPKSCA